MRADIHDGPEQPLQSKAGYIDARPLTAISTKTLATHGRTIQWVIRAGWTMLAVFPLSRRSVPKRCIAASDMRAIADI